LGKKCGYVSRRLGFEAGLLQKPKVAEPIDKTILPGAERDPVAVGQPGAHSAAVG
jgi:hypothetical protein